MATGRSTDELGSYKKGKYVLSALEEVGFGLLQGGLQGGIFNRLVALRVFRVDLRPGLDTRPLLAMSKRRNTSILGASALTTAYKSCDWTMSRSKFIRPKTPTKVSLPPFTSHCHCKVTHAHHPLTTHPLTTHPLTHSPTHPPTHPLTHSPTHPLTNSPTRPLPPSAPSRSRSATSC